ncbi:60S acidic ribosomal protein P0 [Camelus dromedarius]|uniref:Large ribosomal subunit protein uL10 n=1 Tax=Camelus dromedarius TaxID=9838 RepID=A0A5N4D8M5_CAMDR|nr:hypothetical protein CB1_000670010 [Camelus ferus]KAB1267471.1 60S acidic ribosomal protein P0 [Camelus dromedarius]
MLPVQVCRLVTQNVASMPYFIISGYKRVLAFSVENDYTFPLTEKVKAFLADPSAFVAAATVDATTTAAPTATAAAPTKAEAKEGVRRGYGIWSL